MGNQSEPADQGELPDTAMLDFEPVFDPTTTEFGNGLTLVLNYLGEDLDYTSLMGDLGLAFILQASETATVIDGAPDAGWWPLAPDCLPPLLSNLEPIVGRRIRLHRVEADVFRADRAAAYLRSAAALYRQEIDLLSQAERAGLEALAVLARELGARDARLPEIGKPELTFKRDQAMKSSEREGASGSPTRRVLDGVPRMAGHTDRSHGTALEAANLPGQG